jgi:hypothetical protein
MSLSIGTIMAAVPALIEIGSKGKTAIDALREAWADAGHEPDEFDRLKDMDNDARAVRLAEMDDRIDSYR